VQRVEDSHQFCGGKNLREAAVGTFRYRDGFDVPGSLEGDRVQKFEGGTHLAIGVVGTLLDFDLMKKELADLGLTEQLGGAMKEGSELAAVEKIVAACSGSESAKDQVLFHAVVELSHERSPE
jgi:hypothetical protein